MLYCSYWIFSSNRKRFQSRCTINVPIFWLCISGKAFLVAYLANNLLQISSFILNGEEFACLFFEACISTLFGYFLVFVADLSYLPQSIFVLFMGKLNFFHLFLQQRHEFLIWLITICCLSRLLKKQKGLLKRKDLLLVLK